MRGDYWLWLAVLLLFVSLITKQVPLALIAFLFLLTGGVSRAIFHMYIIMYIPKEAL